MSTWNIFSETYLKELPWKLQRYGLNFYLSCREVYYIIVLIHCRLIQPPQWRGGPGGRLAPVVGLSAPWPPAPRAVGAAPQNAAHILPEQLLMPFFLLAVVSTQVPHWLVVPGDHWGTADYICESLSATEFPSLCFKVLQQDEGVKEKGQRPWGKRMHTFSLWLKSSVKSVIL